MEPKKVAMIIKSHQLMSVQMSELKCAKMLIVQAPAGLMLLKY